MAVTCPTLSDLLAQNECAENFAGLGSSVYIGLKSDLKSAMTVSDSENTYSTPEFETGKGLYKFDCKEDSEQIQGSSLGRRKGFELTANFILEAVNAASAKCARALNNLDIFIIMTDGSETSMILYDPNRKVIFESGGIASDTGAAASDDRQVTLAAKLSPVMYPQLYVTTPTGGWDSLLASAQGE